MGERSKVVGIGRWLAARAPITNDLADEVLADNIGPKGAGWLAWQHRKQLRARGFIYVHIAVGVKVPRWFRWALKGFENHARWWRTSTVTSGGVVVYRIEWLGWRCRVRT